jgi:YVTN family beta-propeller protein
VIIDRAGKYLYVSNGGSNTVTVVDAASHAIVGHIPVGAAPHGLSIDATGRLVIVANEGGNNLSIIDTVSRTVTRTVPTGSKPVAFGNFVAEP